MLAVTTLSLLMFACVTGAYSDRRSEVVCVEDPSVLPVVEGGAAVWSSEFRIQVAQQPCPENSVLLQAGRTPDGTGGIYFPKYSDDPARFQIGAPEGRVIRVSVLSVPVVAHELGHAMSLQHLDGSYGVMSITADAWELSDSDRAQVARVFGAIGE